MIALPVLLALALGSDLQHTPPAPAPGSASAGPAGLEVAWAMSLGDATTIAKKTGGRILVELKSEACGECSRQEALILPSTSFYSFTRDKVPVQIDIGSPDGRKLAERFGIPGPPAWIVLTTDGLLCGIQVGPTNQVQWIETFVKTEAAWTEYRKRLEEEQLHPEDLALVFQIAEESYQRGGDELAEPRFRRVADASGSRREMRERALGYLASIALDHRRIDDAEKILNDLLQSATDEMLRERAELRLADIAIARGRKDLAIARLRQFRKDHPASSLGPDATALLKALGASDGTGDGK